MSTTENENRKENDFPGYPHQPKGEDIYNKDEEADMNLGNESDLEDADAIDKGLDIPGAELDDADEEIGEEDEENNYYSLGGDNHVDLEEDRDDLD